MQTCLTASWSKTDLHQPRFSGWLMGQTAGMLQHPCVQLPAWNIGQALTSSSSDGLMTADRPAAAASSSAKRLTLRCADTRTQLPRRPQTVLATSGFEGPLMRLEEEPEGTSAAAR
jgi:hypothetical protein